MFVCTFAPYFAIYTRLQQQEGGIVAEREKALMDDLYLTFCKLPMLMVLSYVDISSNLFRFATMSSAKILTLVDEKAMIRNRYN